MVTGWHTEGDKKYFLTDSGAAATGWRQLDGTWYYFNQGGDMARGWIDGEDGSMKLGVQTVTLDGDNYSFFFTKTGGIEEKGAGLTGKYNKVLYKYGKKIKADADDKYLVVKFDESANTIEVVSSKDLRADTRSYKNDKNETVRATNNSNCHCFPP